MKKKLALLLPLLLLSLSAEAQGGCVNSPECPTALLALLGFSAAVLRARRPR